MLRRMSGNLYESPQTGDNLLPGKSIGPTLLKVLGMFGALAVLAAESLGVRGKYGFRFSIQAIGEAEAVLF